MLTHLGVRPLAYPAPMIERGALPENGSIRVLVLPHAIALSPAAAERIQAFAKAGGIVLADTQPGVFDAHGRRLAAPPSVGSVTLMPELERTSRPATPAG